MEMKLCVLLFLAFVTGTTGAVVCRGLYYQASRVQSQPMGFCWYFFNGNYTMPEAEAHCARHGGRLPAINSNNKAAKLAEFSSAMRNLYYNGSFDRSWLPVYAGGWVGNIIWGDRITGGNQRTWKVTGAPVSYQGFDKSSQIVEQGDSCTTFDLFTGKWRYASCQGLNTLVCEESGHDYTDEKPTDVQRTYVAESCPQHFTLENGRCLLFSRHVAGMFAANLFCTHSGGHLAVVTSENDEKALGKYIADRNFKRWKTFLSPIVYMNNDFVWESTGQSAAYVAQKFQLIPNQALLFDTLVVINREGKLELCSRRKCNARPFCQANDQDYYAYLGDRTMYNDYY